MSTARSNPELLALDAQLATVQDDIDTIMPILAERKQLYHTLLTRRKRLSARTTPVVHFCDLPAEIISRILETVVFSVVGGTERETELNRLRLVSSKWNKLLLQDPAFWKDVILMLDYEDQWIPAVERATTNLRMQKSIPLHVELHTSDLLPPTVISFLEMHSPRISSLIFYLVGIVTDIVAQLENIASLEPWKSLESVTFLWCGATSDSRSSNGPLEFNREHYPALQKLELGGHCQALCNVPDTINPRERSLTRWRAPWDQLTSITLSNIGDALADQLTMLKPCVNLAQLAMRVNTPETGIPWGANHDPITLPSLRFLNLHISVRCSVRHAFINRLTLPSIQSIIYTDDSQHDEPNEFSSTLFQSLSNLIKRSTSFSLESFEINLNDRLCSLDEEAFIDFLQLTSQLKNLAVSAPNMTCDFLLYQDEEENNCMLPQSLERLHITALRPVKAHIVEKQFKEWISWCEEDDGLHSPTWKGIHGKRSRTLVNTTLEIEEVVTREALRSVPLWSDRA
ncbi:hypothetical protein H1R20_g8368, partial [Candolleomyces eurysporus]